MSLPVINKPLTDDREYRNIVLPNGLEALLVQDPTTDKAAAALDVGVGSFADPPDLPGLAHFLEHLLFMGTEKYPSENEYSQFLTDHAGLFNAFTSSEHTNYHFEVSWPHLRECLDRFAQFFIAPLFAESCKSREVLAVDSENKKNLQNDVWRLYQLEKHLSNPEHPIHQFATGSYETLGSIPESQGIDVRARLIEFYKHHYTASIMKLVVISRDSVETLEKWTRDMFSAVPNTHPELADTPTPYQHIAPLRPQDLGTVIRARPVMDIKVLEFTFPVPDQQPLHKTQPYHYYVHLLGHESKGSLLFYLKEKKWATELGCAISHVCKGSDYLFVNIELTNEGMQHWHDIVEALFAYIDMVIAAGPQKWIFEEIMMTTRASFLYRQKSKAMPLSSSLAQTLHRPIPRERLLDYSVATEFDAEQLVDFTKYLSRDNMRVMLVSQSLQGLDNREKWYGTEYAVEPIPPISTNIDIAELHLPQKNEFLPSNFELVKEDMHTCCGKAPKCKQNRPRILIDSEEVRLWHKLDDTFKIPKAYTFLKLVMTKISESPRLMRLADLFTAMINDKLADYAYYADIADVSHSLAIVQDGFEIEVHGFSEKLSKLLEVVMETFCLSPLSEERFSVVKEQQERQLSNLMWAQPATQRALQTNYLLLQRLYSIESRLEALKTITFDEVQQFAHDIRQCRMGAEILVIGNINTKAALDVAGLVKETISKSALLAETKITNGSTTGDVAAGLNYVNHARNSSFLYDTGQQYYKETLHADPENVNSAILVSYQFGEFNIELLAIVSVVSQLLKEASFNQLRTKEQLGYIAGSNSRQLRSTLWFEVFVQSEESTQFLEERIENFIVNVARPLIADMGEAEFQRNIDALVSEQLEKNKNLGDEASRYWSQINSGYYDFYRRYNVANAAKHVTKKQILDHFDRFVVNADTRSRFALHLKAQATAKITPEVALSKAVGQLVTDQQVNVTAQQIQQFMIECKGLTPEQALQLLSQRLVTDAGMSPQDAQLFIGSCVQKSQEILKTAGEFNTKKPIGTEIASLDSYYASLKVATPPHPAEKLSSLTDYEDEAKL